MKTWGRVVLVAGLTLAGVVLLWSLRGIAAMAALALGIAAAARPHIERRVEAGLSRANAVLVTYGLGLGLAVLAGLVVGGALFHDMARLSTDLPRLYGQVQWAWSGGSPIAKMIAGMLPPLDELVPLMTGPGAGNLVGSTLGFTAGVAALLSAGVFTLVLSAYWNVDRARFEQILISLVPASRRFQARRVWHQIESEIGAYGRSELLQGTLAGALLGVGFSLIGLPYASVLAVLEALLGALPIVGAPLALLPPLLIGLLTGSWPASAFAAIFTLTVMMVMETAIEPRYFNRRRYSSLLITVTTLAMVELLGLAGLLLGPPLAIMANILFEEGIALRLDRAPAVETSMDLTDFVPRTRELAVRAQAHGAPAPPEIVSLSERLIDLAARAAEVAPSASEE